MNTDTKKTFYSLSVLKHVKGGGEEREVGGGTKVFETEEKKARRLLPATLTLFSHGKKSFPLPAWTPPSQNLGIIMRFQVYYGFA